ncbi:hypothetical protein SNE40_015617 [Patella caerulea]|uniref:Ionotropic glutamate receptor C-terminal domain-containing protein n=1 Tax=Patella caerulea TaxID=87958 RepID=A0AAN8JL32_PATCE
MAVLTIRHTCIILALVWVVAAGDNSRNSVSNAQLDFSKDRTWFCFDNILESLKTIFTTLKWQDVNIFYETMDDELVQRIIHDIERERVGFQTTVYDVTTMSSSDIEKLLDQIYKVRFREVHIILLLSNGTFELLKIANSFDTKSNKTTNYRTFSRWIILSSLIVKKKLMDFELQNVMVLSCCRHLVYHCTVSGRGINMIDCLNYRYTHEKKLRPQNCSVNYLFPNIKYKYCSRHLLIGSMPSHFLHRHVDNNNKTTYSGAIAELTDILAEQLNFTYTFIQPNDGKYGGTTDEDEQVGLVGMLDRKEVDIVIADLTLTEKRSRVVDFILPPFFVDTWSALRKRGIQIESNWFKIFRPFDVYVYIATIATVSGVAILLLVVQMYSYEEREERDFVLGHILVKIFSNIVFLIGFLSVRGDGVATKKASVRVLVTFLWLFCVVITGVYMGNLTASLTAIKYKTPFNSLEELVELPDWKWGARGYELTTDILRDSKNTLMNKLWKGMLEFNKTDDMILSMDANIHINRILAEGEKYVYLGVDAKYLMLKRNDCSLEIIDRLYSNFPMCVAVTKNSYLRSDLESVMVRLSDNGYLSNFVARVFESNRTEYCKTTDTKRTHRLEDLMGAILIALIGLVTAVFVLLVEKGHSYRQQRTRGIK